MASNSARSVTLNVPMGVLLIARTADSAAMAATSAKANNKAHAALGSSSVIRIVPTAIPAIARADAPAGLSTAAVVGPTTVGPRVDIQLTHARAPVRACA
jgi:hypothetical protein